MKSKDLLKGAFLLLVFILVASCTDENHADEKNGVILITSLEPNYEGPRGSSIQIAFVVEADNVLSAISVRVENKEFNFDPKDQNNFEISFDFDIPGNALLSTEYPISIDITDIKGNQKSADSKIVVGAILKHIPTTYIFERNDQSTVSYTGQNERLAQVEEIKTYLRAGDDGSDLSAQILLDAYKNANGNGNGFYSFSSTKQLENKTFAPDLDERFMSQLFSEADAASKSGQIATNGSAGLITRENGGNTILVDKNGREFTQLIEKGLMGTVMYNQIYNTYFTDGLTGDEVDNTTLSEGKNYTDMEHHWDEAFGYFNPPLDFSSNWPAERGGEDRFWSHYSNVVDPFLGTNDLIMQGFLKGRTAIVNNDLATKNEARSEVINLLDIVAAAAAIHYINSTIRSLNKGNIGETLHTLSEAWAFINALKYNPGRRLSLGQIKEIKESDFGQGRNFWNVTSEGLNKAKTTLVESYPELKSTKDEL